MCQSQSRPHSASYLSGTVMQLLQALAWAPAPTPKARERERSGECWERPLHCRGLVMAAADDK